MCQNFPSCGKRHYGDCASASSQTPRAKKPARRKTSKKSKSGKSLGVQEMLDILDGRSDEVKLEARIESLEARVLQLESRKKYQRELMRKRREEGKA